MIFGRVKALKAKIESKQDAKRRMRIQQKKVMLAKEAKRASLRIKEEKLDKALTKAKTSAAKPSRGKQLLKKLGEGALKAGKEMAKDNKKSNSLDWTGKSPLMQTNNKSPLLRK